jgi:putative phosphoesterase
MIVGILSDTHDNLPKIRAAVAQFRKAGVLAVLHAGDYVAPFSLEPFTDLHADFHGVLGNNDGETAGLGKISGGLITERSLTVDIDGASFYLAHNIADPVKLADNGNWDFVVCGHTHKIEILKCRRGTVINPGEACGWVTGKSTAVMLDTSSGSLEVIEF